MTFPPLPSLGKISAKIAEDVARVSNVIDSLPGMMEHLVKASDRHDWKFVSRASSQIALHSAHQTDSDLADIANELAITAANPESTETEIKRCLLRFIGHVGRKPRRAAMPRRTTNQ